MTQNLDQLTQMLSIHFIRQNSAEIDVIKQLFLEYSKSLNENLCFQSFNEELDDPLKKYGEPMGSLLLAYWNNKPAGCVALQPLAKEGVCEMKRLFVRDNYRNQGIADELVKTVLAEAIKKNYNRMVLDTLERLKPAIQLYTKHGFVNTSAYYENPLSGVVYMQKELKQEPLE